MSALHQLPVCACGDKICVGKEIGGGGGNLGRCRDWGGIPLYKSHTHLFTGVCGLWQAVSLLHGMTYLQSPPQALSPPREPGNEREQSGWNEKRWGEGWWVGGKVGQGSEGRERDFVFMDVGRIRRMEEGGRNWNSRMKVWGLLSLAVFLTGF